MRWFLSCRRAGGFAPLIRDTHCADTSERQRRAKLLVAGRDRLLAPRLEVISIPVRSLLTCSMSRKSLFACLRCRHRHEILLTRYYISNQCLTGWRRD